MFTTIITDCKGENEAGRQISRFNSLGLGPTNLIGVGSNLNDDATIEGSINLIDILDATEGTNGVVVLNVAPRGNKKDGGNGTHFAFFYYGKTLVISTVKGHCLTFVKKLGLAEKVNLVELKDVLEFVHKKALITGEQNNYIVQSQFRSYDFVPRLARWILDGVKIPFTNYDIPDDPEFQSCIWCVDAFGNCKTTILLKKSLRHGQKVDTNLGSFIYYNRLKDIPYGETAIYTGSSGIGDKRFLEIATQGIQGSAAKKLKLKIGARANLM